MKIIQIVCGAVSLLTFAAFAADSPVVLTSVQKAATPPQMAYGIEKWRHGHMISVDRGLPDRLTFTVSDVQGIDHFEFSFSLPDTARVWDNDFDLDARGAIVFAGESYSSDGRLAPFIAVKERDAAQVNVIRTYPYRPKVISVAPDGTIWTSGFDSEQVAGSGLVVNQNGDVIRHFDRSGRLIGSFLPYGELRPRARAGNGIMVATSDRLGWYSTLEGNGVYMEISPDLKSQTVYPGVPAPPRSGLHVEGFALTEGGDAYLTWIDEKRMTYRLDRSLKQWVPVSVPPDQEGVIPVLKGENQGVLVFRDGESLEFLKPGN